MIRGLKRLLCAPYSLTNQMTSLNQAVELVIYGAVLRECLLSPLGFSVEKANGKAKTNGLTGGTLSHAVCHWIIVAGVRLVEAAARSTSVTWSQTSVWNPHPDPGVGLQSEPDNSSRTICCRLLSSSLMGTWILEQKLQSLKMHIAMWQQKQAQHWWS